MIQIDGHTCKPNVVSDPYVLDHTDFMLGGVVGAAQCRSDLSP